MLECKLVPTHFNYHYYLDQFGPTASCSESFQRWLSGQGSLFIAWRKCITFTRLYDKKFATLTLTFLVQTNSKDPTR